MNLLLAKICQEMAGRVLELQRGLNTPERRLELADELQATIEKYLAFEKRKNRFSVRKDRWRCCSKVEFRTDWRVGAALH